MAAEIRNMEVQQVLFVRRTGAYGQAAKQAFGALCAFAGPRGLLAPPARMIGISHDDPQVTDEDKMRYDACVTIEKPVEPQGEIASKTIAGGRYAVFRHLGPYENFQQTYDGIFSDWLPRQGEDLRDEPGFELYLNAPGQVPPKELITEIWIPLR